LNPFRKLAINLKLPAKSACTFEQSEAFHNRAVWPVIVDITGPIRALVHNLFASSDLQREDIVIGRLYPHLTHCPRDSVDRVLRLFASVKIRAESLRIVIAGTAGTIDAFALDARIDHLVLVESNAKCSERLIDVNTLKATYFSMVRYHAMRM
jgi:hypothetical protein